ncbi:MAG TPA: hypothetical protein VJ548_12520 [Azospira sp.]|nr:hypothetical protein [Azospira sp.]
MPEAILCPKNIVLTTLLAATFLMSAPPAQAEDEVPLGRLFFTRERRQALDRQRLDKVVAPILDDDEPLLTLNGMVRRSGGKPTAWINGRPQHAGDPGAIQIRPDATHPGKAKVATESGATVLRVGQSRIHGTGEILDPLPPGSIVGIRAPAR